MGEGTDTTGVTDKGKGFIYKGTSAFTFEYNRETSLEKSNLILDETSAAMTAVSGNLIRFWTGTSSAYSAITTKDANTIYFVTA
jgi:hypothetical protein